MKRIAFSLLAAFALSIPAQAIVGGPFDENLFYSTSTGTYQGTISGKNFSGIMVFGTSDGSAEGNGSASAAVGAFGSDGRFVSFVDGKMVVGYVSSVANSQSREIAGTFGGSVDTGSAAWRSSSYAGLDDNGNAVYVWTSFQLNNVLNISGNFNANFDRTYPALTYSGTAKVEIVTAGNEPQGTGFSGTPFEPKLETRKIKAQVRGIRTSDQAPFFANEPPPVKLPSVVVMGDAEAS